MTIKTIKEDNVEYIKVYHVRVKEDGKTTTYLSFLDEQKAEDCAMRRMDNDDNVSAWVQTELIFA